MHEDGDTLPIGESRSLFASTVDRSGRAVFGCRRQIGNGQRLRTVFRRHLDRRRAYLDAGFSNALRHAPDRCASRL